MSQSQAQRPRPPVRSSAQTRHRLQPACCRGQCGLGSDFAGLGVDPIRFSTICSFRSRAASPASSGKSDGGSVQDGNQDLQPEVKKQPRFKAKSTTWGLFRGTLYSTVILPTRPCERYRLVVRPSPILRGRKQLGVIPLITPSFSPPDILKTMFKTQPDGCAGAIFNPVRSNFHIVCCQTIR